MSPLEILLIIALSVALFQYFKVNRQSRILLAYINRLERLKEAEDLNSIDFQATEDSPTEEVQTDVDVDADVEAEAEAEAEISMKVINFCQLATVQNNWLEDDKEFGEDIAIRKETLREKINKAELMALSISDKFLRGAALHRLVVLLTKMGEHQRAKVLYALVEDSFIIEEIDKDIENLKNVI